MTKEETVLRERLEAQLRFEMLLTEISTGFINIAPDQVDDAIQDAQRRVCESLDIDRSALWQFFEREPGALLLTHIHQPPGSPPSFKHMNAADFFPWSLEKILTGEVIAISKLSDLPPEAGRDQESWRSYGTKATLLIPLSVAGKVIGALSFAIMKEERDWPEMMVKRLQLVAQVFANALARKRAEEALRESEERLSLAAESANVGLWVMEAGTGQFWVTAKARELFGFPPDRDLDLECILAAVHPEDRDRIRRTAEETIQSGRDNSVEYRIIFPDGNTRWILSRGRPYRSSPGDPARLMGVSIDITEQKRAEEELQKSEERILALVENTSDMIWSVDVKRFGLLTFNAVLRNYFFRGHGLEIQVGMTPDDMLPAEYADQWREFYTRALREGSFVTEYFTSAKSHVLLLSINLLKRGGELFGISVFGRDITDRKRAEEDLRLSEERFRQVAENVGDFIWEVDAKGLYLYTSPAVEKILGYTPDELIGKMHFYDLFAPEVREQLKAAAVSVFAAKE
jgi:PAS domain S-box-containing protein